ncbi:MAG: hypothetical protein EOP35_05690 [Rubrivivax sp.]|nr:MAG: hypothetical protein EOP35_05690 [Rubrivivax sp.]
MRNGPWANALATATAAVIGLLSVGSAGAQAPAPTNVEPRVTVVGRKGAASDWVRAESPHFVVYSDAGEDDVTQLLGNLEKLDNLLRIYTASLRQAAQPEAKLTLYFHNSASELREIEASQPADAVGLYSSCARGVQGFAVHLERIHSLADEQLDRSPLNETLSYVFEAYARHFLYRHTDVRAPASFIDGFAQYFSSVRFSDGQMVVGRVPKGVGAYLKFLDEGRYYSLDYDDVLQGRLAGARNYAGAAGVRLEFEAKAWVLTHYMLSSEENRQRLNRYLVAIGRGADPTEAFERVFNLKKADIGNVMWRYALTGVTALRVASPALEAAHVSIRSLPLAAGEFVLANAALKACPSRPAGESLLRRLAGLAARFPDDDLGRLALSRAQIDWGNPQDAVPRLEAMLQTDDASFEARSLLGRAYLRLAERSEGDARGAQLLAAQRHLQRARALNPQSAEVAVAAFRAEMAAAGGPGKAAVEGVITAWQGTREVDALGRTAALVYAFTGDADRAHQTLNSLARNPGDAAGAEWARHWRSRLEAGVSRGDILAELRRNAVPESFKEWTIYKERVMQIAERNAGLERADAFIKEQARQNDSAARSGAPAGTGNR